MDHGTAAAHPNDECHALEGTVAAIWRGVLGLPSIDREDEFFAFDGADSALATRMLIEVQEQCGVEVPLITVFEYPRLCDFCEQVHSIQSIATT